MMKSKYRILLVGFGVAFVLPVSAELKKIELKSQKVCIEVEFEQGSSEIFSCVFKKPISYQIQNCLTYKVTERGDVEAELTCTDDGWGMRFKTSGGIASTFLNLHREPRGLLGIVTSYKSHGTKFVPTLPEPRILNIPLEKKP